MKQTLSNREGGNLGFHCSTLILLGDNKRSKSRLSNSLYNTGDHHNKFVWLHRLRNVHLIAR